MADTKPLADNRHLDFVDRVLRPEKYPVINNPDGSYSTHKEHMPTDRNFDFRCQWG